MWTIPDQYNNIHVHNDAAETNSFTREKSYCYFSADLSKQCFIKISTDTIKPGSIIIIITFTNIKINQTGTCMKFHSSAAVKVVYIDRYKNVTLGLYYLI